MHVEPYLRIVFEKCKRLSHRTLTALSDKRRNLEKCNGVMAKHMNVVKMSEHPNTVQQGMLPSQITNSQHWELCASICHLLRAFLEVSGFFRGKVNKL